MQGRERERWRTDVSVGENLTHDACVFPGSFQLSDSARAIQRQIRPVRCRRRLSCLSVLSLSNFTISVIDEFGGCLHLLFLCRRLPFLLFVLPRRSASFAAAAVRACTD